jgi:hypothetical protein
MLTMLGSSFKQRSRVHTARLRLSSGCAASVQMAVITALLQVFRRPRHDFRRCSGGAHGAAAVQAVSTLLLQPTSAASSLQFGRCPQFWRCTRQPARGVASFQLGQCPLLLHFRQCARRAPTLPRFIWRRLHKFAGYRRHGTRIPQP